VTRSIKTQGAEIQRIALARDVASRLGRLSMDGVRALDKLAVLLEHLRSLSWTRHASNVDRMFHVPAVGQGGSFVTRCDGRWPIGDAVETSLDGPPLHLMCGQCVERWARGKDVQLYGVLELARDLATEDMARAELHEGARVEMTGGGS
jgi:hypothetical protein